MTSRRAKAEHEARHVVVGSHSGCRVLRATIDEFTFDPGSPAKAKITTLLAGNPGGSGSEGRDDRRLAKRLVEYNWPESEWKTVWRECEREAARLVRSHASEIQDVADVIEKKGKWRR